MKSLGIIGCGKMGQALASKMINVVTGQIICCDINQSALDAMKNILGDRATYTSSLDEAARQSDIILLAVKPMHAQGVLRTLNSSSPKCILSIVAGLNHQTLTSLAGSSAEVVRIMPNTPALVGAGSIVIFDHGMKPDTKKLVELLFSQTGTCHFIQNEAQMDAVTGLSGSSPALFAMMAEAIADAAVAQGLPRDLARDLAKETMLGTAKLLDVQHPAILKENVMSPAGTTAAGVLAAEKAGFRFAAAEFVRAASEKSKSIG